tara:strand:- start:274 stop:780 length:507 start_codon:yes stop_codon:yes gene_type:complete
MKIETKSDINFHKLTQSELQSMIGAVMNECAFAAKQRIEEGFDKEFDINGIGFEPNAFMYEQTKLTKRILTESGRLSSSIKVSGASPANRSAIVGTDVDYGVDLLEDRILKGTFSPARLWFFTTDNLGTETGEFLKQYDASLQALRKFSKNTYIPFFLKQLRTSMRIL